MAKKKVAPVMPPQMMAKGGCSICDGTRKTCNICGDGPNACGCDVEEIDEYIEEHGDQFDECESCKQ